MTLRIVSVALLVLLSACRTEPPHVDDAPEYVMEPELRIGAESGDVQLELGSITGIALDTNGRLFVADANRHQIRVFDSTGRAAFVFGRSGDGPGEVNRPCCISFDSKGRLWVWSSSANAARYDVFSISLDRAAFAFRIAQGELGQLKAPRVIVDSGGRTIHPASGPQGAQVRVTLDSTGAVLRRIEMPPVSPESLGMYAMQLPSRSGRSMTVHLSGPASAEHPIAHSPHGGYADAMSSRYAVRWFDNDGTLLRTLRREIDGPPFTDGERAALAADLETLRSLQQQAGRTFPEVTIPDRKHPLAALFFDLDGRLWVVRATQENDSLFLADVFDRDGRLSYAVRWPRDVSLRHGAIAGTIGYGIQKDSLDVPFVVRMRLRPSAPPATSRRLPNS